MASSSEAATRLEAELALLDAMYPGQVIFDSRSRDLNYTSNHSSKAKLTLRIPEQYPLSGAPDIISACDAFRNDIRDTAHDAFREVNVPGDEILDQLVGIFEDLLSNISKAHPGEMPNLGDTGEAKASPSSKTVIIWLHHLLATSKRKLAVNPISSTSPAIPESRSAAVSGITKPGYPGIMIFSGPRDLVDAHVCQLKSLNWQAFQVRYDSTENVAPGGDVGTEWSFQHRDGKVVEVETMAEVVKGIEKEEHKQIFLTAIGVK